MTAARSALALHAYGEAADLLERALELWPRVAAARRCSRSTTSACSRSRPTRTSSSGDRVRGEALLEAALAELDEGDAQRRAVLLGKLAQAQWVLNRPERAIAGAQEALALLPDEARSERAALLAWIARTRALRGRYREATSAAEEALVAAEAAGEPAVAGQVLNTLGMALAVLGRVDEGVARLRRALAIAREADDLVGLCSAYANLADTLHVSGRTSDALPIAREGLAAVPSELRRSHDWLSLVVSELAFESGGWRLARAHLLPAERPQVGRNRMFVELRVAELALGEGEHDEADRSLGAAEPLIAASFEPQWHGAFGALLGELRRRQGDLAGARQAVQDALDRLEVCTDDVMRIARVTAVGIGIEADRAQRARDLHEPADARDALARVGIHLRRLEAAAAEGGSVEAAWRLLGQAESHRAKGRHDAPAWEAVARAWEAVGRPYQAVLARWRQAEAQVEAEKRDAAGRTASAALHAAREMGARWVAGELESLCDRARLDRFGHHVAPAHATAPPVAAPFGLTARELQVLTLVAQGATNRQIGAALFMAEKTASVHVSRILAKLDVRSRTQAAAVAHRLRLG